MQGADQRLGDPQIRDPAAFERLRRIGGEELVERMVAAFMENAPQRLSAAVRAAAKGDREALARAVHSLRSTAGNLGATRVQGMAEQLEGVAETADQGDLIRLTAELERHFDELVAEIRGSTGEGEGRGVDQRRAEGLS